MVDKPTPAKPAPAKAGAPPKTPQLGSRLRVILFALPLLFGWGVIYQRRFNPKSQSLPSTFALCSSPHQFQIYTLDPSQPWVECLVARDGKLAHVGSLEDVRTKYGDRQTLGGKDGIKMFRMKRGQMALPGLIDSHAHLLQYGESVHAADLVGAASVGEVVERLARFVEGNKELKEDKDKFILGLGWDQTKWAGGEFPTAADVEADPRLAGRPIYLKRIDVHALWVSQNILDRMSPLPDTVSGGKIVRDAAGDPTGIMLDNAMDLVAAVVPPWTDADRVKFLTAAARSMLDHGLTSAHDAALSLDDIAFLKHADQAGRLPIRIYGMTSCAPLNSYCGNQVERYDGDRFQLRAVKIFADGALGSRGAALHEDYSDDPGNRGIMISGEEEFAPLVKKWIDKGFQVNSHGIGDRANTVILDAYEASLPPGLDPSTLRLRNEHTQILRPADIARMGRLGVISSVQPTHATSDMAYAEVRLGPERIKGAYAWQSLIKAGSRIALGSDFPVEKVNPFLGIYAAVTRKWLDGDSPHGREGWFAEQALSLEEAIKGFTLDGAYASFQEGRVGSLEVGKEADFVVLNHNLFVVEESEIPETEVKATVVGGRLFAGKLT